MKEQKATEKFVRSTFIRSYPHRPPVAYDVPAKLLIKASA